jgi:hypothetical protein
MRDHWKVGREIGDRLMGISFVFVSVLIIWNRSGIAGSC